MHQTRLIYKLEVGATEMFELLTRFYDQEPVLPMVRQLPAVVSSP
jgi:hypothetical protein